MATRFRFPSAGSPAVSPAIQSYSHSATLTRRPLARVDSSALATVAITPDGSDHLVAGDTLHAQFVSAPLATGTVFTIGDAFKCAMQGLEAHNSNNLQRQIFIGVVSEDGATARATLRTKILEGTELATSLVNRFFSGTLDGGYTTVAGDRLVVEISVSGTPTGSGGVQGHNASLRFGSDGAGGDLPEDDTENGTTFNPWIEFANTLGFVITSAQAGAWSDANTWAGGVVPGDGDQVVLSHVVTVSDARTVGTSPADTGPAAISLAAGGKLVVNSILNCRGPISVTGGSTFTPRDIIEIGPGGDLVMDASQATDPTNQQYAITCASAHFQQTKIKLLGTAENRATLRSNAGGGNAYITAGGFLDAAFLHVEYGDLIRIGDATNRMLDPSIRNTTDAEVTLDHAIMDACGETFLSLPDANAVIDLSYSTWKNTASANCINASAGMNAPGGGITRRLRGCVFDKVANLHVARGMTIGYTSARTDDADWVVFDGGIVCVAASLPASMHGAFIREAVGQTVATIPQGTSLKDFYLLNDYGGIDPHFISHLVGSGTATNLIERGVFETQGSNGGAGNGILAASPAAAWTTQVRRVIVLPDDNGNASANLVHHFASNTNHTVDAQFNTAHARGDGGGCSATSNNARYAAIKNNIFWDTAANSHKLTGGATSGDTIAGGGANVDYNCGHNLLAGSDGKGYNVGGWTVAPGANDIDVDPKFFAPWRRLAAWDEANGGAGTRANARTEMRKKNEAGFNTAYHVRALLEYIEAGYRPRNQALKDAASDGTDIGAVAVMAAPTIEFDAVSQKAFIASSDSVPHTPVGTPRGVFGILEFIIGTDPVDAVSYGVASLTRIANGVITKATGETMGVSIYFRGTGVPTGAQSLQVNLTSSQFCHAFCVTVTATGDVEVVDSDNTINSDSIADPAVTLQAASREIFALLGFVSGQNATSGATPRFGWTERAEGNPASTAVTGLYTFDTYDSADVVAGWRQSAEDAVAVAAAIAVVSGVSAASDRALLLSGAIAAAVAVAGASSRALPLSGTAQLAVAVAAVSSTSLPLSGAAAAAVAVDAASANPLPLAGSGALTVAIAATSSLALPLAGSGVFSVGATEILAASTQSLPLAGPAASAVRVAGESAQGLPLTGTSSGTVRAAAASTQPLPLAGSVAAQIAIGAASTKSLALAGELAGAVLVRAQSTQALPLGGPAAASTAETQWIVFGPVRDLASTTYVRNLSAPTQTRDLTSRTRIRALTS